MANLGASTCVSEKGLTKHIHKIYYKDHVKGIHYIMGDYKKNLKKRNFLQHISDKKRCRIREIFLYPYLLQTLLHLILARIVGDIFRS